MSFIDIQNLSKIYNQDRSNEVPALDRVSLQIQKGEFVSIMGASGSGKSTLLNILGGLETQTSGHIFVNGRDIGLLTPDETADYRRKEVGFVFQNYNLIPILSAEENILLPAAIGGDDVDKLYFDEIVARLGLHDRLWHLPGELSGGQQQRVGIARALMMRPSIILADEPTGNLDSNNSEEIVSLLKELSESYSQTVVMISHSRELAQKADCVVHIADGKIVS